MARIRSIHPSLYTDEDFMSLSLAARVVLPGLWTECDDQGLFAWKPLTLKARILPADNADMVEILVELKQAGFLCSFMHDGREYGAVRNFRKFQRPKKPTNVHILPTELRTYVGLSDASTPPVPHQSTTKPEKSPQMEDEGGKMEDVEEEKTSAVASRPAPVLGPEFIRLPTNRFEIQGEEFPVYDKFAEEMQALYPAIDVRDQLRAMRAWLLTHDRQRKTKSGMKRFINSWLSRSQNSAPRETLRGNGNGHGRRQGPSANDKFLAAAQSLVGDFLGSSEGGDDSGPANEIGRPLLSA